METVVTLQDTVRHSRVEFAGARALLSHFDTGRREVHAMITVSNTRRTFAEQLEGVVAAADALEKEYGGGRDTVFKRYFLSDATNQAPYLPEDDCAVSVVQQPPLDGSKLALWILFQQDGHGEEIADGIRRDRHGIVWMGDKRTTPEAASLLTPHLLSVDYLQRFADTLSALGGSLRENCLRTWFFVRDIDVNYRGVVSGRNEMFTHSGLTPRTHFLASTGIEGSSPYSNVPVCFNAVADTRISEENMTFLKGLSHLNPTIEYGVAFERGTAVDYADRRHVYISGTASIDNRGEIVAPGDIVTQTERMLENIGVLLEEAGCTFDDLAHLIVYLRDTADHGTVERIFDERFPYVPRVIVRAPVCRPGWLIETECMAIRANDCPEFINF